jgi:hypothetical protein
VLPLASAQVSITAVTLTVIFHSVVTLTSAQVPITPVPLTVTTRKLQYSGWGVLVTQL